MIRQNLKRFYKEVTIQPQGEGFEILLDGRAVKTPLKLDLIAPTKALAEIVADEWRAQDDKILPHEMPVTQLLNTALDRVPSQRQTMEEQILTYLQSELVCYFSAEDEEDALKQRETEYWQPMIQWTKETLGIELKTCAGILHVEQDVKSFVTVEKILEKMNDYQFTAFQQIVPVLGSLITSLALYQGRLDIEGAYKTAFLEQLFQCDKWGADDEIQAKLDNVQKDLNETMAFLEAVNA